MRNSQQILTNIRDAWSRLSPVQKATSIAVLLVALGALITAVLMSGQTRYEVLFSNLSPGDGNAIVEKLKEAKVPYRLQSGGAVVEVPADKVYELRLQMAGKGLPQGSSVGFELFDKPNFGMTEFTQKLEFQRALQGELTRTICQLAPVEQARVHIVLPERNLFSDQQIDSSASVVVKLRPGMSLSVDQVSAITTLVSAAVQGLKPSGVAVVDTVGNLLSEGGDGPFGNRSRMSSTQLSLKRDMELQVMRDLQLMLDRVVGPGKTVVRVNADLDFDTKETSAEMYEPAAAGGAGGATGASGVVSTRNEVTETYNGAARRLAAPTAGAAVANALGANGNNGDTYRRTENQVTYQVTKRTERTVQAPGKIKRLAVSVMLDSAVGQALVPSIRQAVSGAAGIDSQRGDQIEVVSVPFDRSMEQQAVKEMAQAAKQESMTRYIQWGGAALLAIILLLFTRSLFGRMRGVTTERHTYDQPLSLPQMELQAFQQQLEASGLSGVSDSLASTEGLESGYTGNSSTNELFEAAKRDPEAVPKVLRRWLNE